MMAGVSLFSENDTRLDLVIKITAVLNLLFLFINSFFGYWISTDDNQYALHSSNWNSFCAGVIIFYITVEILSFVTFVSVVYCWSRVLFCCSLMAFLLFTTGLANSGLRENVFCFIMLFLAIFNYLLVALHFKSIEMCQERAHSFACRGSCLREEYLKEFDERVFGKRLSGLYSTQVNTTTTHVQFNNEDVEKAQEDTLEQNGEPKPVPRNKVADREIDLTNNDTVRTARREVSVNEVNTTAHMDTSSHLQI